MLKAICAAHIERARSFNTQTKKFTKAFDEQFAKQIKAAKAAKKAQEQGNDEEEEALVLTPPQQECLKLIYMAQHWNNGKYYARFKNNGITSFFGRTKEHLAVQVVANMLYWKKSLLFKKEHRRVVAPSWEAEGDAQDLYFNELRAIEPIGLLIQSMAEKLLFKSRGSGSYVVNGRHGGGTPGHKWGVLVQLKLTKLTRNQVLCVVLDHLVNNGFGEHEWYECLALRKEYEELSDATAVSEATKKAIVALKMNAAANRGGKKKESGSGLGKRKRQPKKTSKKKRHKVFNLSKAREARWDSDSGSDWGSGSGSESDSDPVVNSNKRKGRKTPIVVDRDSDSGSDRGSGSGSESDSDFVVKRKGRKAPIVVDSGSDSGSDRGSRSGSESDSELVVPNNKRKRKRNVVGVPGTWNKRSQPHTSNRARQVFARAKKAVQAKRPKKALSPKKPITVDDESGSEDDSALEVLSPKKTITVNDGSESEDDSEEEVQSPKKAITMDDESDSEVDSEVEVSGSEDDSEVQEEAQGRSSRNQRKTKEVVGGAVLAIGTLVKVKFGKWYYGTVTKVISNGSHYDVAFKNSDCKVPRAKVVVL